MIDVISYLNNNAVRYWTSGKNVKKGEINIKCFNHADKSNHLRINPATGDIRCWHCGYLGKFTRLIQVIEDCNPEEAYKIYKKYSNRQISTIQYEQKVIDHPNVLKLPSRFSNAFPELYKKYLERRGFNFYRTKDKYNLMASPFWGKYKFRIIIPIIMDGKMVSFVGRDITGEQYLSYQNCEETQSVLPRKEWIFNYDSIRGDTCIICEGTIDAMKLGDGCIATLSANFTLAQILKLKKKGVEKFFLAYDSDETGENKSKELEASLSFAKEIHYIQLPDYAKDPGELKEDDIAYLRRQIF